MSSVLTDLHGVTGRDIMDHLIAGDRSPKVLAQLARAAARRKISELEEAVEGAEFFTAGHAALLAVMLARIDRLSAGIDDLSQVIEQLLVPYEGQLAQAESMPGRGRRAAQDVLAGTGPDMSRFLTAGHLAWMRGLPDSSGVGGVEFVESFAPSHDALAFDEACGLVGAFAGFLRPPAGQHHAVT